MQLSETIKLYMTKEQRSFICEAMNEYIKTVNSLVSDVINGISLKKITTKDFNANLPSAIKNQCIRDANSIVNKHRKNCHKAIIRNRKLLKKGKSGRALAPSLSVVKKPCLYVNNQNFKVSENSIEFPILANDKSKRLSIRIALNDRQKALLLNNKLGTLRIIYKNKHIVAQVVYEVIEPVFKEEGNYMGVDLGIKCPAVSYTSDGSVCFYGNGRKNKYMRRHYAYLRKKLQTKKKIKAVTRINNKEQRIMKDIDHKISHDIVTTAVAHNVKVIKLEDLSNVRSATRKSRKNNRSLHSWSFYRLAQFIEYKAKLAGIAVEYVDAAYTSQTCPKCGHMHHADDRNYVCKCGYHIHRDLLGAINICNSTEFVGNRQTA